jgi:hypothetical protein
MSVINKVEPLGDRFSLDEVINGIAVDLADLRAGRITIEDARVRAELAKQYLAGIRMVVSARKYLEESAKLIGQDAAP